jgi:hypothetical protein
LGGSTSRGGKCCEFETPEARIFKVPKLLITIDREGGHVLVDRELWEKVLQEKMSIEELKLLKPEEPKWSVMMMSPGGDMDT